MTRWIALTLLFLAGCRTVSVTVRSEYRGVPVSVTLEGR